MSSWDQVKQIPIDDVAQLLGVKLSRQKTSRCPFPSHNDSNPSFSIDRKRNLCYCHACGVGGSVIDFAAIVTGRSPSDVVSWLRRSFHPTGIPTQSPNSFHALKNAAKLKDDAKADFHPNPEIYSRTLSLCPQTPAGRDYLRNRSITDKTQTKFSVGFVQDSRTVVQQLLSSYSEGELVKCGLLYPGKRPQFIFSDESLLFPFYVDNEVVYLQSRSLKGNGKRWMGLNGVRKPIYNLNAISGSRKLYICEGVMDALSSHELGYAAIGLIGANAEIPLSVLRSIRGKTIYMAPDNDEAGLAMARRLEDTLRKMGIQHVTQRITIGNDLNDYLVHSRKKK
ncbi:toprim domain-containing protein [Tardiphaga sp.]|uniref:toprim domain-containing protein n=1 Tax=Tardiphaga sp. TaxID=1926292 RepID=UPI00262DD9AC|nr:toprim domain-containing protein [Tardiphaga sp.]